MSRTSESRVQPAPPAENSPSGIKGLVARIQKLRIVRVFQRFSGNNASLLSAGMSYQSLFALFAAIWVGFSVAGIWLVNSPEILRALITIINNSVPGLIGPGGVIKESTLTGGGTFGITGIIALASLLWTAIGWLGSTRQAIRAMFELPQDSTNFAIQKARDLGLAAGFGLLLIVAALVSIASTSVLSFLLTLVGLDQTNIVSIVAARVVGIAFTFALNGVVLGAMFRVLSRVAIPRKQLIHGAVLGSLGLSVLSILSGSLLGGASKNPLLATFAVLLGLLIWLNLVWQVLLLSATWIAVEMADDGLSARKLSDEQLEDDREARLHDARVIVAQSDLEHARSRLATAGMFARIGARRDLDRATRALADLDVDPETDGASLVDAHGRSDESAAVREAAGDAGAGSAGAGSAPSTAEAAFPDISDSENPGDPAAADHDADDSGSRSGRGRDRSVGAHR